MTERLSSLEIPMSRRRILAVTAALGATGLVRMAVPVGAQSPTPSPAGSPAAFTLINLNTATDAEIMTIPGMSDRMVKEFKEYRPYGSILQFRKEIGKYVDDAQVAAWEAYVFVPIAVNDADSDTLQQLPGVDEAIAKKLTDGRPYADNAAFLKALKALVSAADFQNADKYLATAS